MTKWTLASKILPSLGLEWAEGPESRIPPNSTEKHDVTSSSGHLDRVAPRMAESAWVQLWESKCECNYETATVRLRLWECKCESAIARLQLRVQNERAPNAQLILLVWAGIQWRPRKTTEKTSSLRITNILCCTPPSQGARRRWPMPPRPEHRPEWLCCPAGIRKL